VFEKRKAKKAGEAYAKHLAAWQEERDGTAQLLELAQTFEGDTSSDTLLLKPGEHVIGTVTQVGLIEERRGAGQWEGASRGVSFPIGSLGGRSVRYRVGRTRGHYVQGAPVATAVDTGTLVITDQRAVYEGSRQTRECAFAKLLGVEYGADGSVTFQVSNRQKPTTLHYGPDIAGWVHFRIELALARFRGTVPQLEAELKQQLAGLDEAKPVAPPPAPG
jgi:hypothetical protein